MEERNVKFFISMPRGEVTDTFFTSKVMEKLREQGEVICNTTDHNLDADEIVQMAYSADVIICGWGTVKFTKDLVKRLPNLKIIAYTAGSMAPVVEKETFETGVVALTGNYIFAQSVAEGCLTYTLCALREIEKYMNIVRNGGWRSESFYNRGLIGKKVGLIGFGEIAKQFVKLLKPFEVEILVNSSHVSLEETKAYGVSVATKEEIFSECDIVSLHMSLTEKTVGVIDRKLLEMLKPDAVFVNTARGRIVDCEALEELLSEGRFSAALDVFHQEPLDEDSVLRKLKNVVLLPHMGGPTIDMRENIALSFIKDFKAYKENRPMKNVFKPESLQYMTK